eukprot:TRINITY_DN1810_c0_g1_i2.p1 TRINITY_DN1810_c0_g1~~TRINITY_DN1810_c0_g1_i2.p1  ORF type:complete len:213 (-),score=55.38 TRINITY_DN1810_c0_g1_i2:103-741(-)
MCIRDRRRVHGEKSNLRKMGLWAWTLSQFLTPKFWKLYARDGFIKTYVRGHRAVRHSQYIGGHNEALEPVGQDQYGNKYYEDFDVNHRNQRRWVEYSDYFIPIGIGGDRVPAGWHGWLSHQFDDVPSEGQNFVDPHYRKEHTELTSGTPSHHVPPGNPKNPDRLIFFEMQRNRKNTPWIPDTMEKPGTKATFRGKKLVLPKHNPYEDVAGKL